MGTNSGPSIANSYMYGYESKFIDKLCEDEKTRAKAEEYHMTFRLIDDTLSIDNRHWSDSVGIPAEQGGIYPAALTYNNTSISNKEVTFLGTHLSLTQNGRIKCDVFDKRSEFPFEVQRYPDMKSFIPRSIPYGVFVGLLHRTYRICSDPSLFLKNTISLATLMVSKGCSRSRLLKLMHEFLVSKIPLKWSYPCRNLYAKFKRAVGTH